MNVRLHLLAKGAVFILLTWAIAPAIADDSAPGRVTFYKDVLPILQENCQACHQPVGANSGGMIAPMGLMTYQEVRPWAKAMARQVESRAMPPWFASEHTEGLFTTERTLSDEEIETVVRWASTGAAAGRTEDAPPAPETSSIAYDGWTIGKPDLIVPLDEPFLVKDDVLDLNISLSAVITEEQLPEGVWVQAVEFRPGSEAVHHICATAIAPDGESDELDSFMRNSLGCIAPGADSRVMPEGFGLFLPKGATIRFSMHYHKEKGPGTAVWDRSAIGFVFNKTPVKHRVRWETIGNSRFEIPPNHSSWEVGASKTFEEDTTIIALWPHMHLRGSRAKYIAYYPDGTEELLLHVPSYDYNWQVMYPYRELKEVPAGTRVEVTMWFDNSPERAARANLISDRAIRFGGPTTEEMMLGFIDYTETKPKQYKLTSPVLDAGEDARQ